MNLARRGISVSALEISISAYLREMSQVDVNRLTAWILIEINQSATARSDLEFMTLGQNHATLGC